MPKIKGMALLHPSYILRDQSMIPVFIADLKKSLLEPPEHYNIYPSLQDVQNFTATTFAFDIETSRATGEIICVGLSDQVYHAMVVPSYLRDRLERSLAWYDRFLKQ